MTWWLSEALFQENLTLISGQLHFGDKTGSSPMLKKNGASLQLRLGNDLDFASLSCGKLILPLAGTPTAPTLAFGDGDSGIYSEVDNVISISSNSAERFQFSWDDFRSVNTSGPSIQNEAASDTNPVYCFRYDIDTGIGHAGADQLSLIAGGVEALRLTEDTGAISSVFTGEATFNSKVMITAEGGIAIRLTNKTGASSVKGTIVSMATSTDDAVEISSIDDLDPIGIMYSSGVVDGSEVWVVTDGKAEVLLEDSTAATRGNWVRTGSTTAGRADATATTPPGAIAAHFQEIGHCAQTVTGGTNQTARVVLHFN